MALRYERYCHLGFGKRLLSQWDQKTYATFEQMFGPQWGSHRKIVYGVTLKIEMDSAAPSKLELRSVFQFLTAEHFSQQLIFTDN